MPRKWSAKELQYRRGRSKYLVSPCGKVVNHGKPRNVVISSSYPHRFGVDEWVYPKANGWFTNLCPLRTEIGTGSLMSFTSRLISACSVTSFTGQYSLENLCCKRFSTLYRTGNGKQQRITGKKKRQTTIIKKLYFPTFHGGCYKLLIFFWAATLQPQPDMLGECKGVPSLHHIYIFFVY